MVAAGGDELFGDYEVVGWRFPGIRTLAEEEAGAMEVDVGHVEAHRAALGYFPSLVQIGLRALRAGLCGGEKARPSAGEQSTGGKPLLSGAAETVHGSVYFG